jgi:23S rRNA (uridine2552-2'-O)-methyltransferase
MHADNWAQKAKKKGYRSRAVFKLEEILKKTKIMNYSYVLDLGSSPGGWSEYIIKKYPTSKVYAIDILDMEPIDGVTFFKDSIENLYNLEEILKLKGCFKLVISDIAPNLSGISAIDSENILNLNMLTVKIANDFLDSSGSMIIKTFQNSNLKTLRKNMELSFKLVQTYKPAASKKQSGEIYLYGVK